MIRIWNIVRALASRSGGAGTNFLTDLLSPVFMKLQDELIQDHIPPVDIPLLQDVVGPSPLDDVFIAQPW